MGDNWVGVLNEGLVDFSRGWTGVHVSRALLRPAGEGLEAPATIANRGRRQCGSDDREFAVETADRLFVRIHGPLSRSLSR